MEKVNFKLIAETLQDDLNALSNRRTVRRLDASDVAVAIDEIKRARRADKTAAAWSVKIYGGFVPNSYNRGFGADSDYICVTVQADGSWDAMAWRGKGCNRSRGEGNPVVTRVHSKDPGHYYGSEKADCGGGRII